MNRRIIPDHRISDERSLEDFTGDAILISLFTADSSGWTFVRLNAGALAYFEPDAARRVAAHLTELADEADLRNLDA